MFGSEYNPAIVRLNNSYAIVSSFSVCGRRKTVTSILYIQPPTRDDLGHDSNISESGEFRGTEGTSWMTSTQSAFQTSARSSANQDTTEPSAQIRLRRRSAPVAPIAPLTRAPKLLLNNMSISPDICW